MKLTAFNHTTWKQKAMAFVTRSYRHLWGKNSEGPQAFLFTCGLKNNFIKKQVLGWNKFGQNRPRQNWGLEPVKNNSDKLFLGPGIVIPFIIETNLESVFILPYKDNLPGPVFMIPGSSSPTMILGKNKKNIIMTSRILDGMFLFQELESRFTLIIHPDMNIPLKDQVRSIISKDSSSIIFLADKTGAQLDLEGFTGVSQNHFQIFRSREKLLKKCAAM